MNYFIHNYTVSIRKLFYSYSIGNHMFIVQQKSNIESFLLVRPQLAHSILKSFRANLGGSLHLNEIKVIKHKLKSLSDYCFDMENGMSYFDFLIIGFKSKLNNDNLIYCSLLQCLDLSTCFVAYLFLSLSMLFNIMWFLKIHVSFFNRGYYFSNIFWQQ